MQNDENDLAERTYQFGRGVLALYATLPNEKVANHLGFQLVRSGTSVGANYREARRGRSKPEFISKLRDCLKEADESSLWLRHLSDSHLGASALRDPLRHEVDELIRIFVASLKTARGD